MSSYLKFFNLHDKNVGAKALLGLKTRYPKGAQEKKCKIIFQVIPQHEDLFVIKIGLLGVGSKFSLPTQNVLGTSFLLVISFSGTSSTSIVFVFL